MLKRGDKRGQELSTNAIILIVLGIVVLVILIIGFTVGWNRIAPWLSSDNVNTVVTQCESACSTGSVYDFCGKVRKLNDGETEIETSCATFAVISEYSKYGIAKCPEITCELQCDTIKIAEKQATEKATACETAEDDITSIAKIVGENNKFCCIAK